MLGVAVDAASPFLNNANGTVGFPVTGGATLTLVAADAGFIQEGGVYTATAVFTDGSRFVATFEIVPQTDRPQVAHTVRITADLAIADRDAYGPLGGNALRDRSVLVRYRRAGGGEPWTSAWMKDGSTNGAYVVTLAPQATWEIQAVFRTPDDEGLLGTTSEGVVVRVAGDCAAACPAGGAR